MNPNIPRILTLASAVALAPLANAEQPPHLRVLADAGAPNAKYEHRMFIRHLDDGERETVAFLGVETMPVSPALTSQLTLPKGAGLVVRHVVPESPAASVLQQHDILLKLDDQLLIATRQLAVLVRNHKEGDEVELTYIRGGKQTTAKVKLTKHEAPKLALAEPEEDFEGSDMLAGHPGAEAGMPPEEMHRVLSLLDRRGNHAIATARVGPEPAAGVHGMAVNPGNSNMVFSDESGTLELTLKDGKKTLVARNAKGEQLYSGPIDTPEQRASLPKEVSARLEKIEGMQEFSFEPGPEFHGEFDVLQPRPTSISLDSATTRIRISDPENVAF
jgi:hypothetical protein